MTARPHRILFALFCISAALGLQQAGAQQQPGFGSQAEDVEAEEPVRRYSVELILFSYSDSVSAGTEIFVPDALPEPPMPDTSMDVPGAGFPRETRTDPGSLARSDNSSVDESDVPEYGDMVLLPAAENLGEETLATIPETRSVNLRVLAADELTLTEVHEKLLRLDAYRPVLWTGWEQDVREEAETPAIRLRRLGNLPLQYSGDLKLYLGRFLHLVADLQMEAPATAYGQRSYRARPPAAFGQDYGFAPDGYGREAPVYYRIDDDRIMKSGDLRYFDHPKFGMLATLTRVEETDDPPGTEEELTVPGIQPAVEATTPATAGPQQP
jgi:hypothetical protein